MKTKPVYSAVMLALYAMSLPLAADIAPSPTIAEADPEQDASQAPIDESRLRCWQYGELLFEESRLSGQSLTDLPGQLEFAREDAAAGRLHLLNFGTATCLYEE